MAVEILYLGQNPPFGNPAYAPDYTCICVVKLNCKKAISTYHDKHVFVTVESLTKSRLLRDIGPG